MSSLSETQTLEEVCPLLGMAYTEWKTWEAEKDEYKSQFFALANEAIEQKGLAMTVVEMVGKDEAQAVERVKRHNPGWVVDESRPHRWKERTYDVVLKEDQAYAPFTFVYDGMRYTRTVSRGSVLVDDEWLAEEDPELYRAVTYQMPWGDVVTIPVEHLDKHVLGRLGKFIYNGTPRVRLSPPAPVKAEE